MGCSQQYVAKVTTENSKSEELVVPDHLKSHTDKADFRKLPHELQEQVRAKQISMNAAAIQAGKLAKLNVGQVGNGRKVEGQICPPTIEQAASMLNVGRWVKLNFRIW